MQNHATLKLANPRPEQDVNHFSALVSIWVDCSPCKNIYCPGLILAPIIFFLIWLGSEIRYL